MEETSPSPPPGVTGVARLLSELAVASLDLHGLTVVQAEPRVLDFITSHSRFSSGRVIHVITGKGTHSEGPAVLWQLVQHMLEDEVAEHVDEYSGMIGGGGWVIRVE